MRPIIGITPSYDLEKTVVSANYDYVHSVELAGGLPLILPITSDIEVLKEIAQRVDGLLFTGGPDLDPLLFDEEPLPGQGSINPPRDFVDIELMRIALAKDLPILGICRGVQVLAVAAGGSLYQDIPSQVKGTLKHAQAAPRSYATHSVTVKPGTKLACIMERASFRVNTFHHQAVKDVPHGFIVSAEADDGIVECIESATHRFALGTQFHPECFWEARTFLPIFQALVRSAAGSDK
ncbi:MAG: gamma-glutamyl-gamma-aminobutyrate hydrolase family protein [Chloroflexota bacterium]